MIGPDVTDSTKTLLEVVLRTIRVAGVGTVQSYDQETQTAQVLPDVLEEVVSDGAPVPVDAVSVFEVPVVFPGSSHRGISYGLDAGDRVLLVYRHRSHTEVDGGVVPPIVPEASHRMSLTDVVALPFALPGALGPEQRREDGALVLWALGSEQVRVGTAMAALALARADRVQAQFDALKTYLDAHVHPFVGVATAAPGITLPPGTVPGSPVPPDLSPTPPIVAADRLLVDS